MPAYTRLRVAAMVVVVSVINVVHVGAAAHADDRASSQNVLITEFSLPTNGALPGGIVVGPDDALWFYRSRNDRDGDRPRRS